VSHTGNLVRRLIYNERRNKRALYYDHHCKPKPGCMVVAI
jgi:hypothetical protein